MPTWQNFVLKSSAGSTASTATAAPTSSAASSTASHTRRSVNSGYGVRFFEHIVAIQAAICAFAQTGVARSWFFENGIFNHFHCSVVAFAARFQIRTSVWIRYNFSLSATIAQPHIVIDRTQRFLFLFARFEICILLRFAQKPHLILAFWARERFLAFLQP